MIDMETHRELHSETPRPDPAPHDLSDEAMNAEKPPGTPFLLLLPPTILGFHMHDKKWSKCSIFGM